MSYFCVALIVYRFYDYFFMCLHDLDDDDQQISHVNKIISFQMMV